MRNKRAVFSEADQEALPVRAIMPHQLHRRHLYPKDPASACSEDIDEIFELGKLHSFLCFQFTINGREIGFRYLPDI